MFVCLQPEGELQKLMMGGFELPTHRKISLQCQDLLRHLMTVDPDERFSAEKCLCHPWFQKVHASCQNRVFLWSRWSPSLRAV